MTHLNGGLSLRQNKLTDFGPFFCIWGLVIVILVDVYLGNISGYIIGSEQTLFKMTLSSSLFAYPSMGV